MLDESTRGAILRLEAEGHGARAIARLLGISRGAVKRTLRDGRAEVPPLERAEKAEPFREQILELFATCKGNLVRVHEELTLAGARVSYPALTAFCRRHGIGHAPARPAGHYDFRPGEEMQHDTSPHEAILGDRPRAVVTASIALCYSRMIYAQMYPRFRRFECKLFLTDAFGYFGGACTRNMIDNTHVIVAAGTGRDMVPAPEMAAFAERYGFEWRAHAVGDANRSARVERPFDYIDNNFLAGRRFADWEDLNGQLVVWCDKSNATHRRHLHASPRELFVLERAHMKPLPAWVPEVYVLHHRIVDTEGYVNVNRNAIRRPGNSWGARSRCARARSVSRSSRVRARSPRTRVLEAIDARVIDPAHRPPRHEGVFARRAVTAEETRLGERMHETRPYVVLLKKRGRGTTRDLRWLLRIVDDYHGGAVRGALEEATRYGMADLERLERMVLRRVVRNFFAPPGGKPRNDDGDDHDR
ncbi:MAG TPA: IS21 family transposase [Gemmatimonadaceae bacterium]|nr:IS21 family transposase [Gemmatimonadaceae bacterium]